jgi:hypothetical protein
MQWPAHEREQQRGAEEERETKGELERHSERDGGGERWRER